MKIENIYQVIDASPYLSVLAIFLILTALTQGWWRFMRYLSIRKHGWPPEHCDADGDAVESSTTEELED